MLKTVGAVVVACAIQFGILAYGPIADAAEMSAAGRSIILNWRAEQEQIQRQRPVNSPGPAVAGELAYRVALDQAGRRASDSISNSGLPQNEQDELFAEVWTELTTLSEDNTGYLKSVLPMDGWFRKSRDGEAATHDAWLLLQHSSDQTFQRQVVNRMAQLAAEGEVDGADYALLYDRLETIDGRPQRYGSQATCKAGVLVLMKIEDPAKVDERRKAVGLTESLANYQKRLGVGKAC